MNRPRTAGQERSCSRRVGVRPWHRRAFDRQGQTDRQPASLARAARVQCTRNSTDFVVLAAGASEPRRSRRSERTANLAGRVVTGSSSAACTRSSSLSAGARLDERMSIAVWADAVSARVARTSAASWSRPLLRPSRYRSSRCCASSSRISGSRVVRSDGSCSRT